MFDNNRLLHKLQKLHGKKHSPQGEMNILNENYEVW